MIKNLIKKCSEMFFETENKKSIVGDQVVFYGCMCKVCGKTFTKAHPKIGILKEILKKEFGDEDGAIVSYDCDAGGPTNITGVLKFSTLKKAWFKTLDSAR